MFEGICKAANELRLDRSVRAVILKGVCCSLPACHHMLLWPWARFSMHRLHDTGEGKVFSAGLDVKSVASNPMNFSKLLKRPEGMSVVTLPACSPGIVYCAWTAR